VIRIVFFLLKITLLTAAVIWLANRPGLVSVNWLGYEITTSVGIALLALLVLVGLMIALYATWRALVGIPQSLSLGHLNRRQRKGYMALTQGLVAVAAGDGSAARKLAYKAEKYLDQPALTLLLQAQAAQLAGDEHAAARYYNSMLAQPQLSFLGLRGLITQAVARGDIAQALTLARRAQLLQPKADWVLTALVDLEARSQNWQLAGEALARAIRQGAIGPERGKVLKATLLVAQAQQAQRQLNPSAALDYARKAHEALPGFVPAATIYARLLLDQQELKAASKIIERCWRLAPHPELVPLYKQAGGPLSAVDQLRRLERLASYNPDQPDSHLMQAQAALDAQLWGVARHQLELAQAKGPSRPAAHLMAQLIEKDNGADNLPAAARAGQVQEWLTKATQAPAGPVWTCQDCQQVAPNWQALCPQCGALGTLVWKPVAAGTAGSNLPLLLTNAPEIRALTQNNG